ncbi:MAG TPA: hypothetical protein DCY06_05370 [Bacteroidetes bacterium]|nr:hypothetical protein [Bacteroidota bacterium]HRJ99019.1 hypothetical protein [Ignavibacteria bacterium]
MKHSKFKIKHLKIRIIKTLFTLSIVFIQHSASFAQSKPPVAESDSDFYPTFLLIFITLIISSIFIGLEILGDPKYESDASVQVVNNIRTVPDSMNDSQIELFNNSKSVFNFAYYFTVLLLAIHVIIFLLIH